MRTLKFLPVCKSRHGKSSIQLLVFFVVHDLILFLNLLYPHCLNYQDEHWKKSEVRSIMRFEPQMEPSGSSKKFVDLS